MVFTVQVYIYHIRFRRAPQLPTRYFRSFVRKWRGKRLCKRTRPKNWCSMEENWHSAKRGQGERYGWCFRLTPILKGDHFLQVQIQIAMNCESSSFFSQNVFANSKLSLPVRTVYRKLAQKSNRLYRLWMFFFFKIVEGSSSDHHE